MSVELDITLRLAAATLIGAGIQLVTLMTELV